MPAGLQNAQGDIVLSLNAAGAGTVKSGTFANSGAVGMVFFGVHCTAITGTTPTLDVALEESSDGSSWSALTGAAITQLTAAGHRIAFGVPTKAYVRASATVGGTTPSVTATVGVIFAGD